MTILISHIHFVRARRAQEVTDSSLHFRAPFGLWGSVIALFFCILVVLTKNFSVFTHGSWGNFDYKNFITGKSSRADLPFGSGLTDIWGAVLQATWAWSYILF